MILPDNNYGSPQKAEIEINTDDPVLHQYLIDIIGKGLLDAGMRDLHVRARTVISDPTGIQPSFHTPPELFPVEVGMLQEPGLTKFRQEHVYLQSARVVITSKLMDGKINNTTEG